MEESGMWPGSSRYRKIRPWAFSKHGQPPQTRDCGRPPEWATIALAYVKEVDLINSRRQEALPGKKGNPSKDHEEGDQ